MSNNFIDNIIFKYFINIKTKNCATSLFKKRLKKLPLLSNYINNRFADSESWTETIWRIRNKVYEKPKCKECGKPLKFPFKTYCSTKCRSHNKDVKDKTIQTCLNKYGVSHITQNKTIINKIQNKLNSKRDEITEKSKKTKLERYGDENYNNTEKNKQTKLKNHGDENYNNIEKIKQTNLIKYGYFFGLQNEKIIEKSKKTKLEKYGNENYNNIEKNKQTCLEKYGVDNIRKTKFCKEKIKQTCLEKYGEKNYRNPQKHKQTCLEKYGVNSYTQTKEFKNKINWKEANIKQIKTKKKNGTIKFSKPENDSYLILKEKYQDIQQQYISQLYPFHCDFYIPSLDLYIECNYHWTHGGHPFNPTNIDDINKLNHWKEKNTKFYQSAIKTWTIRDVYKREIAKKNNLKYLEIWNFDDIYKI